MHEADGFTATRDRSGTVQILRCGLFLPEADRHLEVVAESVVRLWEHRADIGGLEMVYEPATLRFFTARFRPLEAARPAS